MYLYICYIYWIYLSNVCSILKLKVRKFGLFYKSNKAPFCAFIFLFMVQNWKGILLRDNFECRNPHGHQMQKQKAKLGHNFNRAWQTNPVQWQTRLPIEKDLYLHSLYFSTIGPGSIWAPTLAHMYWANDVSEGRTAPQTKGSLPPLALGLGKNMEFNRSFITAPLVPPGLDRALVLAGTSGRFSSNSVAPLLPSAGLQLALLVRRLQTLNWHKCIVQMEQSHWPAWN